MYVLSACYKEVFQRRESPYCFHQALLMRGNGKANNTFTPLSSLSLDENKMAPKAFKRSYAKNTPVLQVFERWPTRTRRKNKTKHANQKKTFKLKKEITQTGKKTHK